MTNKKRRNRFRTTVYQSGLVKLLLTESGCRCFYCDCKVFPFSYSYNYVENKISFYFERYEKGGLSYAKYLHLSEGERLTKKWKHKHRLNLATVDHLVSIKDGGSDDKENLVISCASCNSRKGKKSYTGLIKKN